MQFILDHLGIVIAACFILYAVIKSAVSSASEMSEEADRRLKRRPSRPSRQQSVGESNLDSDAGFNADSDADFIAAARRVEELKRLVRERAEESTAAAAEKREAESYGDIVGTDAYGTEAYKTQAPEGSGRFDGFKDRSERDDVVADEEASPISGSQPQTGGAAMPEFYGSSGADSVIGGYSAAEENLQNQCRQEAILEDANAKLSEIYAQLDAIKDVDSKSAAPAPTSNSGARRDSAALLKAFGEIGLRGAVVASEILEKPLALRDERKFL